MKNRSSRFGRKWSGFFSKRTERPRLDRKLFAEALQAREMMAADIVDPNPAHNWLIDADVNYDYAVTPLDALLLINGLNSGQAGPIGDRTGTWADGLKIDTSNDGVFSPLDALTVINGLNRGAQGAATPLVGFTYQVADQNGTPISNNQVAVGQLFQVRIFVQDLRGFGAQGVYAAYLDMDYSDASKFSVQVGETQSFSYFYNNIRTDDTTSAFSFNVGSDKTAAVSLFNADGTPRSADQFAAAMQSALEALPSVGSGNVTVKIDAAANGEDQQNNVQFRNNFEIRFINGKANQDIPQVTPDASAVKTTSGAAFTQFAFGTKTIADPNNPDSFKTAFTFSDLFPFARTASNSTNKFDEIGAIGGTSAPSAPAAAKLFGYVTLKATQSGSVTFTPNQAGDQTEGDNTYIPLHDVLVFPKDTVTRDLVSYGNPFTVTIVDNIVANADSVAVEEDSGTTQLNVLSNDQLINGSALTISAVGTPSNGGTATIVSTAGGQRINYTPAANFFGTETFTYTITNSLGSATTTVTATVTPINDPISVTNQSASTNLGTPVSLSTAQLTAGGSVGTGESSLQSLSIASAASTSANGGTVTLNSGTVTYTPTSSFSGTDTFTVVVTDSGSSTHVVGGVVQNPVSDPKTQTITVTVTVTNHAPDAVNDLIQDVDEDSTDNVLNVLGNDSAGAGDTDQLTITAVSAASQGGSVTIAPNGQSLIYTPILGTIGTETFTYTVRDRGGLTDTATVTLELQPTILPRARTDRATVAEDTAAGVLINVLSNDRPNTGSNAILVSVGTASNGTVTIDTNSTADQSDDKVKYVPNANFFGTDTFTYVMDDTSSVPGKVTSTGTVTVTVTPVNDAPVPVNDTASATEDTVATIAVSTLLSNDSPGAGEAAVQDLTITSVQAVSASGGTVSLVGSNVIYTPSADFNGTYIFSYTVTDKNKDGSTLSDALTATALVTISVAAVNDAPIVVNDTSTVAEDGSVTIQATTLLSNDTVGPATATDESGQTLTITGVSAASANGGTVTLASGGGSVTYTPTADFFGTDTFTYTVTDSGSQAQSKTGTVTVTVTPVNDAPIATADTAVAFKGIPLTINGSSLTVNDRPGPANESNQRLTITSVTPNANTNGTVILNSDGTIVYTPTAGYTGPASFSYTVQDNGVTGSSDDFKSATATVSIDVKEFVPSSIAGTVYVDETMDGVYNKTNGERALGGVVVTLAGTAFGQPVLLTQTTLADGSYSFDLLAPGNYTVSFVNPSTLKDGHDTAGSVGDADGVVDNNAFGINIVAPGGVNATGYNFAVNGTVDGYGTVLDRLASSYYASNPSLAYNGMYFQIHRDNSAVWFSKMDGFANIAYAEAVIGASGTSLFLTVVDQNHDVWTAQLGKGKFLTTTDSAGNVLVRVLGGYSSFNFTKVTLAAPPIVAASRYLDSVDEIFGQEGW